jgi:hypothetical protein
MKSWLLSSLRHQYQSKGREVFLDQFKNAWLLWEPGSWTPPQRRTMTLPVRSIVSAEPQPVPDAAAEALAVALSPDTKVLTLGRGEDCELVINDATLSGRHLAFHPGPGGTWAVEDLRSTNGSRLGFQLLGPGVKLPLTEGASLEAGQARFTYCSPEGLWARLSGR